MANNQLLASDNFASGSLAAGWSANFDMSKCQVVTQQTEPNALSTNAGQIWTGATFPKDQISEVAIGTLSNANNAADFISPIVRASAAAATRYQCDITHTTASGFTVTLSSVVAGSPTSIGSATNVSVASGDVFTLCAMGAAITVYHNGTRLIVAADASITSGSPGYIQSSSVALANTRVSSWRGYSAAQQDGVWAKQGIVIPALAGDIPATGFLGIQSHGPVIREGNAQILSGLVYKMWFDNFVNVYYAESIDGVNWTRKSSPVVSSFGNSAVIKNGATYYMFAEASTQLAAGPIQVLTSSDGINWTVANNSAITVGVGWDSANLYPFFAAIVYHGTWYGFYGATANISTTAFSLGLATSPDGINWTKYPGNPVISQKGNACGLIFSKGKFYTWLQGNQPGQGNASAPFFDPVESVRYVSTDLIHWSFSAKSVHNSNACESLNANTGYCCGGYLIDIGGKAYNYVTVGTGDAIPPSIGQMELAIGSASTAAIVLQPEDAAQQTVADGFTSGIGGFSNKWTTQAGASAAQIVSGNLAEATSLNSNAIEVYTGATFGVNQYAEVTVAAMVANVNNCVPIVRASASALTRYEATVQGPTGTISSTSIGIYKVVAGVVTQIGPFAKATPQVGDVWRLAVINGSDGFPILSLYQNGFLMLTVEDYSNAITSGNPGLLLFAGNALADAQISNFAAGNAGIIPPYANTGRGTRSK